MTPHLFDFALLDVARLVVFDFLWFVILLGSFLSIVFEALELGSNLGGKIGKVQVLGLHKVVVIVFLWDTLRRSGN